VAPVFSDLDADGDPDLILACEWGPIRVFLNEGGAFMEATKQLGLEEFKGFWNGVATGDFDGMAGSISSRPIGDATRASNPSSTTGGGCITGTLMATERWISSKPI